jgi:hypothetical protein
MLDMEVAFTRHHEMIPNEDGSQVHEHLVIMARTEDYYYAIDVGRSEIEDEPFMAERLAQWERLAEMGLRRYIDDNSAPLTARD